MANPQPASKPVRTLDSHKGSYGRVLIVGGSPTMFGAATLAALAALRSGAGLVQVAVPAEVLPWVISRVPEVIGLGLERGNLGLLVEAASRADVLVIGPGMGTHADSRKRLGCLLKMDKPAVIDADALNILAASKSWPGGVRLRAVMTPHPGEMARLWKHLPGDVALEGPAARRRACSLASQVFGQVVLLKGRGTVVAQAGQAWVNSTGTDALAKAGAGDVLSGLIGSLMAQGLSPWDAARLGAFVHGLAGQRAARQFGRVGVLAHDVADAIPLVLERLK